MEGEIVQMSRRWLHIPAIPGSNPVASMLLRTLWLSVARQAGNLQLSVFLFQQVDPTNNE